MVETRSICTNTNSRIRIKASEKNKSEKNHKEHSLKKKRRENEKEESKLFSNSSQVLAKSKNKTDVETLERRRLKNKGFSRKSEVHVGNCLQRKELQSPTKEKLTKPSKGKELKTLPQSKAVSKLLNSKKVRSDKKSRVVQSLNEKFSAVEKVGKHQSTTCNKRKKDCNDQSLVEASSDEVKKRKTTSQNAKFVTAEQISCSFEETQSNPADSICELQRQVSNGLQGKLRRKIKHKLKDRKLVNPLGEIYIPANIAKTEDFLTFLCLRGKLLD